MQPDSQDEESPFSNLTYIIEQDMDCSDSKTYMDCMPLESTHNSALEHSHSSALEKSHTSDLDQSRNSDLDQSPNLDQSHISDLDQSHNSDLDQQSHNSDLYQSHNSALDQSLPVIDIPQGFEESVIHDPIPVDANAAADTITYKIGKSIRGSDQLISSDGYSYGVQRRNKNGTVRWQCVVRNKNVTCYAAVFQTGNTFVHNETTHNHPGVPAAYVKNSMRASGIASAISNPYKSGLSIAKELQRDNRLPKMPATTTMARTYNRHREKTRPKHPSTLENFTIDQNHVPDFLETWELTIGKQVHIMWSSIQQQGLLRRAKTWYVDGTFKLVKHPFAQLFSIHAFISNGEVMKQVPLMFVLMSRRKIIDYRKVLFVIQDRLGQCAVQQIVMDFERATWQAIRLELPDVQLRGCTFHWCQAVWRKAQQLGLQMAYNNDAPTHNYIKKLLALPMLPQEHIQPVFDYLCEAAVTEPLHELVDYINRNWIRSNIFPPSTWSAFFQSVRTNNDTEGWHAALNRRASKAKLPLYLLVKLLAEEAKTVGVEVQLVSEGTLSRYQRRTSRQIQGRLFECWEDYMQRGNTLRQAKHLLSQCSGIYHPGN